MREFIISQLVFETNRGRFIPSNFVFKFSNYMAGRTRFFKPAK